MQHIIRANIKQ